MDEKRADFAIFKEPGFLIALALTCGVFGAIGFVMYYVQS
jgi:hypothetical protein